MGLEFWGSEFALGSLCVWANVSPSISWLSNGQKPHIARASRIGGLELRTADPKYRNLFGGARICILWGLSGWGMVIGNSIKAQFN